MAKLKPEQMKFLSAHGIPLSRVFDASGLAAPIWKQEMKDLDMWVAFGGSKCRAAGHQLRARNSDCLQCRPAAIGYRKRFDEAGEVYVASSKSRGLLKVGMAKDATARIIQLKTYVYGGASDWVLRFSVTCKNAGKVELEAHRILKPHLHYGTYFKDGDDRECRELFKCGQVKAVTAVRRAILSHSS